MLGAVKERIVKDGIDDGGGVYMVDCSKLNTLPSKDFFSLPNNNMAGLGKKPSF
jgi:hypothetical protein